MRPVGDTLANSGTGLSADNMAIVPVGNSGQVSFYTSGAAAVDLQVDVEGYVSDGSSGPGATYAPLTPARIVNGQTISSSSPTSFNVLGVDGLPTTASQISAVAADVTAIGSTTNCNVAVTSASAADPPAAQKVQTYLNGRGEQFVVVGPDSSGNIYLSTNCASVMVFVDLQGYYLSASSGSTGDAYVPVPPTRVVDTRSNLGITGKMTSSRSITGAYAVNVLGVGAVPSSDVDAVSLMLTTLDVTGAGGWMVVWPEGQPRPLNDSSAVIDPSITESNLAFVQPGSGGDVDFLNSANISNDLLVDVDGYFLAPTSDLAQDPFASGSGALMNEQWDAPDQPTHTVTGFHVVTYNSAGTAVRTDELCATCTSNLVSGLSTSDTYYFTVATETSAGTATPVQSDPESVVNNTLPAEKQDTLAAMQPQSQYANDPRFKANTASAGAALPTPTGAAVLQPAVSDSGTASDVSAVKTSLVNDINADRTAGQLATDLTQRAATVTSPTAQAQRNTTLVSAWDSSVVAGHESDEQSALTAVQADPTYQAYSANAFTVTAWEGVVVTGNTATALALGHDGFYSAATGWTQDDDQQWQASLNRVGTTWRMTSLAAVDPDVSDDSEANDTTDLTAPAENSAQVQYDAHSTAVVWATHTIVVNRPGVVAWADKYWQRHNCSDVPGVDSCPDFDGNSPAPYQPLKHNDCTDFASDALHVGGGIPRTAGWHMEHNGSWWPSNIKRGRRDWTDSWTVVKSFLSYWKNTGDVSIYNDDYALKHTNQFNHAAPGDPILIDQGLGAGFDHTYVEVGSTITPSGDYDDLIDAHGNDHYHVDWREWYDAIRDPVRRSKIHAETIDFNTPG